MHANGTKLYSARIIPFKGSCIEFATDINNVMYAYIDREKKLPVTTLLRAIGFENDKDILEIFNLAEDVKVNKTNPVSYTHLFFCFSFESNREKEQATADTVR